MRRILKARAVPYAHCVQILAEHQPAGILEAELLWELEGAHASDSLEVVVEARGARTDFSGEELDVEGFVVGAKAAYGVGDEVVVAAGVRDDGGGGVDEGGSVRLTFSRRSELEIFPTCRNPVWPFDLRCEEACAALQIIMSSLSWATNITAVTLLVSDLDATKAFYLSTFGLPIVFEDESCAVFQFKNTLINLLKEAEGNELLSPEPVAEVVPGARFVFTIGVDDVDAVCVELASRGVELVNGPMDRPWGIRTASFKDPAGYVWEISKDL